MHRKKGRGFTLIELLITVGIIVILSSLIIVNIQKARARGRDAKRVADVSTLQLAMEMYYDTKRVYPNSEPAMTAWAYSGDGGFWDNTTLTPELKSYLSPLPKDPINKSGLGYRYYVFIDSTSKAAIIKTKLEEDTERMKDDSCSSNTGSYDIILGTSSLVEGKCADTPTN